MFIILKDTNTQIKVKTLSMLHGITIKTLILEHTFYENWENYGRWHWLMMTWRYKYNKITDKTFMNISDSAGNILTNINNGEKNIYIDKKVKTTSKDGIHRKRYEIFDVYRIMFMWWIKRDREGERDVEKS